MRFGTILSLLIGPQDLILGPGQIGGVGLGHGLWEGVQSEGISGALLLAIEYFSRQVKPLIHLEPWLSNLGSQLWFSSSLQHYWRYLPL